MEGLALQPLAPVPDWLRAGLIIEWRKSYGEMTGYCTGFDRDLATQVLDEGREVLRLTIDVSGKSQGVLASPDG